MTGSLEENYPRIDHTRNQVDKRVLSVSAVAATYRSLCDACDGTGRNVHIRTRRCGICGGAGRLGAETEDDK